MKITIAVIVLLLSNLCVAQIDHWESVVLSGDEFKYLEPSSTIQDWYETGFDDLSWSAGPSGFGYGDDDDATILESTVSVYLRHTFNIVTVDDIQSVLLDMDFDDGFVAYINGEEVARFLMSGDVPSFDQPADGLHEANLYQGIDPERYEVDKSLLVNGVNSLAIAIHNESLTSSDMTCMPTLSLGITSSSRDYRSTPEWFDIPPVQNFISSNLPIVIIETNNSSEILDEPKIDAALWILSNNEGQRNFIENKSDSNYQDYQGNIRIEIRGSSSQDLPKKQYGFTTYGIDGEKDNVTLLDMPKENDWILNSLAFDPSLIRDYLTYNLYRQMGNYTTRTRFCDVMINGEYQGLYVLQEKLKADDNRIDINKIDENDNTLPQLSGGYVIKADKPNGDPVAWEMDNYGGWTAEFIHDHPKPDMATIQQKDYLENVFRSLEATARDGNSSITEGYPSIIDVPSFIDFMLINELASNPDAYQFSTYFHKDRNGKLRAGPIWDTNLTYGNDLFEYGFDRSKTDIWQFFDGNMGAKFWKDLYDDEEFNCYLTKRWNDLIGEDGVLNEQRVLSYIDETVTTISESIPSEEEKWGRVGDHAQQISDMKAFLSQRYRWMSNELGSSVASCVSPSVPALKITAINYHPLANDIFDDSDFEFVRISNTGSVDIDLTGIYFGGTGFVYQFPNNVLLAESQELYLANETGVFREFYGFTPYDAFSRSLDNGGQTLQMLDAMGNLIDEVTYDDTDPWPLAADGDGSFLELIDYQSDNDLPQNWRASRIEFEPLSSSLVLEPVLTIYPNPFDREISLRSNNSISSVLIYNMEGKQVYVHEALGDLNRIALKKLETGVYFLHVKMDHGILIRKILKQ
ncbi:MAG: hypothetical protein ACJAZM_002160 [Cyclobacteriaceae bacterium]|jgi:hypothetical protein